MTNPSGRPVFWRVEGEPSWPESGARGSALHLGCPEFLWAVAAARRSQLSAGSMAIGKGELPDLIACAGAPIAKVMEGETANPVARAGHPVAEIMEREIADLITRS